MCARLHHACRRLPLFGFPFDETKILRSGNVVLGMENSRRAGRVDGPFVQLSTLIAVLHRKGLINFGTRKKWDDARRIRNKAIHDEAVPPRIQVERLLEVLHVRKS
jgi:hypothetical protein